MAKKKFLEKDSKFFKAYFIVMIIYAALGIFSLFSFRFLWRIMPTTYIHLTLSFITGLLYYAVIILSIIALIMFIVHRFRKGTLVLPIYVLVFAVFFFIFNLLLSTIFFMLVPILASYMLIGIPFVSYAFMLAYSIYMLVKFK